MISISNICADTERMIILVEEETRATKLRDVEALELTEEDDSHARREAFNGSNN